MKSFCKYVVAFAIVGMGNVLTFADDNPLPPKFGTKVEVPGSQKGVDVGLYTTVVPTLFDIVFGTIGVIGVILISAGGIKAVISRGNAEEFKKAVMMITYTAIGMVIIGLAYSIIRMIVNIPFGQ